jgi:hypothetical protein
VTSGLSAREYEKEQGLIKTEHREETKPIPRYFVTDDEKAAGYIFSRKQAYGTYVAVKRLTAKRSLVKQTETALEPLEMPISVESTEPPAQSATTEPEPSAASWLTFNH